MPLSTCPGVMSKTSTRSLQVSATNRRLWDSSYSTASGSFTVDALRSSRSRLVEPSGWPSTQRAPRSRIRFMRSSWKIITRWP